MDMYLTMAQNLALKDIVLTQWQLILKKNDNPFKNEAKPFIKYLVKNKILFYDAKLAAKFVNKLWNENIDDWWNDNKTQKAINKFITNYANTTNNISE